MSSRAYDAVVVGAGHNGLVAAALLARAGRSVLVLERSSRIGGAAVSHSPFPGVDVRLSRYSYLVSLFPRALARELGLALELRARQISSYTPDGDRGVLVRSDQAPTGSDGWADFYGSLARLAKRLFPTLTQPLRSRDAFRRLADDEAIWSALIERPLSEVLERTFSSDVIRGVVLTDALIGTFAAAGDPALRQNRCFLYHVIGNGTGRWDVPIGGMGQLTGGLVECARAAGAEIRTDAEVSSIATDGASAEVRCADGMRFGARHVLAAVAPAVLARLLGVGEPDTPPPEGSQLKVNMVLRRLPRLRDRALTPELAFAGTFHVNEGYAQLQAAYEQAAAGEIPSLPPCELYCHSLTDPSILGPDLRAAGAHSLTLFGLHMPARLFATDPVGTKREAVEATLRSLNSVLGEPIEDCLWVAPNGEPCLEALTPPELESELAMPGGHIFHRDLAWPFAEAAEEVGQWGVETEHANLWLCGAGARRGGGVSGIPGYNAAQAVLASDL
ncbi:MAG: phytoene desaturase family protein [Solirubrobacteraceae bacterium]